MNEKPQPKRVAVFFRDSVSFVSEVQSVSVGTSCDRIEEMSNGRGLLISRKYHDRNANKDFVAMAEVPWSNIKSVKLSVD